MMNIPLYASWTPEERHQAKIQGIFRRGQYYGLDKIFDEILPLCPQLLEEVLEPYAGNTIQEQLNNMYVQDTLPVFETARIKPHPDANKGKKQLGVGNMDNWHAFNIVWKPGKFGKSEVSEESQEIVDEFIDKGLFKESEGAIGIDMEDVKLGFFMARKSDGTTPYITKDLALARRKFEGFDIERSLYVVGNEQKFHFQQLFEALKRMGFKQADQCYHLSYGHVVRSEGKMSSRTGNTFTFKR